MRRMLQLAALGLLIITAPAAAQVKSSGMALGVELAGMDRTARPQDDFFRFVNGKWDDATTIPADKVRYGSFEILRDNAIEAVNRIILEVSKQNNTPGSNAQKIADMYRSFMDSARVESLGVKPLAPYLAALAKVNSTADLSVVFPRFARLGARTPLAVSVGQDLKNSNQYVVYVSQSGLGMPDRDYYLRNDERFTAVRKAYTDYIEKLFTLAGQPDGAGAAQRILALETRLAEKQWERARSRDRDKLYNKMTFAQLKTQAPGLDWDVVFKELRGAPVDDVIVFQPDYLQAAAAIITETPVSTWKEYLTAGLLNAYADELSSSFAEASFNFGGKTINGQKEQRPRWRRGVGEVESILGEPLGKLYVDQHFTAAAKARMDAMVKNLLAAFKIGIDSLDWMSPATKLAAQEKLSKYKVKIGYPDKWRDFTALEIQPNDLVGNLVRARQFAANEAWARLDKPAERWRWGMTPQTVNASYSPANNEITFPAAILQPPFFNVDADDATNYGAIGVVIGHEISHGFDDQGRKSDGDGNLRDWWTAEDAKAFEAKTSKLGAQYEAYEPLPGMHINGKLTMGENIGDLSGMAVAYRAYHISLGGKEAPVIEGFTGDQRFFLGHAQVWRDKMREEAARNRLLTDPHSPGRYRAFVPVTNVDAWYAAFNVQPGDKLYRAPADRVKIW
jgi:putative endopeptidase